MSFTGAFGSVMTSKIGYTVQESLSSLSDRKYLVDRRLFWFMLSMGLSSTVVAVFLAINVAKLAKAKNELKDSRERYIKAFSLSPEAMVVHYRDVIIMGNESAADIIGVSDPEKLKGREFGSYISSTGEQKNIPLSGRYKNRMSLFEYELSREDGGCMKVLSATVPFPYDGKNMKLSVIKDLTEHYMLREAVEMDRLKTHFFSNVSHELRTPLNVILSTLQLMQMYSDKGLWIEKEEESVSKIGILRRNCYRLLKLVSNLIDITKLDAGYYEMNIINSDVVSIVRNTTQCAAQYMGFKNVSLKFSTDLSSKVVACNPGAVERVLLNLLSNAVKFGRDGGTVHVSVCERQGYVDVSVKDNGIGIPESRIDSVFDKFIQLDETLMRKHEGGGIGLSLARSLVEMQGGRINLKSKPGEGSEFIVSLPAVMVEANYKAVDSDLNCFDYINKAHIELSDISNNQPN